MPIMLLVFERYGIRVSGVMIASGDQIAAVTPESPSSDPENLLYEFSEPPMAYVNAFHGPYLPPPLLIRQAQTQWLQRQRGAAWLAALNLPHGGKMFGLLVVMTDSGLRYLAGYSGKLAGRWDMPGFVPPIFDLAHAARIFERANVQLVKLAQEMKMLETSADYQSKIATLAVQSALSKNRINALRKITRQRKQQRAIQRLAEKNLQVLTALDTQSLRDRAELKRLRQSEANQLAPVQRAVDEHTRTLAQLREQRAAISQAAQLEHFSGYQLLNGQGASQPLDQLIAPATPSGGAGDCAAPKLLQFAWKHGLKPLALAEFWLGETPAGEIRHDRQFYPPCRSRCAPILHYMLPPGQGTDPDNPYMSVSDRTVASARKRNPMTILYEDEHLLVIDKPSGLLSVAGRHIKDCVSTRLAQQARFAHQWLQPAHRLDMDTSGILLLAKTAQVLSALQRQFELRSVSKRYIALLDGKLHMPDGEVDLPLRVDLDDRPRQIVCAEHGKAALTRYEVLMCSENTTRVLFEPVTGRTHQLRVHAAHKDGLATPILGDPLYGNSDTQSQDECPRMHLHAVELAFVHPLTNQQMCITSPVPF